MFVLENIKAIWKLIYRSIIVIHIYIMAGICLFFFLLLQVSSSLSSYILLSFSFISRENVLFPASNHLFSRRVLSKIPCIEGNWSFETRWTFDAEQCSIKFHIKKSWFLSNSVSFTFLEWVSVRSRLVIKFSLSLPIQKSLQVASGMLWRTSNIVNQNVFMNNEISIL